MIKNLVTFSTWGKAAPGSAVTWFGVSCEHNLQRAAQWMSPFGGVVFLHTLLYPNVSLGCDS